MGHYLLLEVLRVLGADARHLGQVAGDGGTEPMGGWVSGVLSSLLMHPFHLTHRQAHPFIHSPTYLFIHLSMLGQEERASDDWFRLGI